MVTDCNNIKLSFAGINILDPALVKRKVLLQAPEVISKSQFSEKSDIFELCLILYEVVTRQVPFSNLDADSVKLSLQSEQALRETLLTPLVSVLVSQKEVDEKFEEAKLQSFQSIFENCLQIVPQLRMSCEELVRALYKTVASMFDAHIEDYNSAALYMTAKGTNDRLARKDFLKFYRINNNVANFGGNFGANNNNSRSSLDLSKGSLFSQSFRGSVNMSSSHLVVSGTPNPLFTIKIKSSVQYQKIIGFGGSFTEAAAYNFSLLKPELQKQVLELYFGKTGNKYSFCRMHMNSCDFSLDNYNCCEVDSDFELKSFQISQDLRYLIPFIKSALKHRTRDFKLIFSPWSPPAWMKANGKMNGSDCWSFLSPNKQGLIKNSKVFKSWALFFSKFVKAYSAQGIYFFGCSIQNEPEYAAPWDGTYNFFTT